MLLRYFIICISILVFVSCNGYAKSVFDIDGLDWKQWSESMKSGYVAGFMSGTSSIISEIESWKFTVLSHKKGLPLHLPREIKKLSAAEEKIIKNLPKEIKERNEETERMKSFLWKNKDLGYDLLLMMHSDIYKNKGLSNFVVGQLLDGLNEFYSDFRNKRVPIACAIGIVKMQVEGCSKEAIEYEIKAWRNFKPLLDKIKQEGY